MKIFSKFIIFLFVLYNSTLSHAKTFNWVEKKIIESSKRDCQRGNLCKRKLLITGCARSGTTFISRFMTLSGFDVPHETCGDFGAVSWLMAADDCSPPWGESSLLYDFENIFHQVRNPLKSIASVMSNLRPISWKYICKHTPAIKLSEEKLVQAAKYWYYWNLKAEAKASWTYRLEDLEDNLEKMSRKLGVYLDPNLLKKVPNDTNHRNDNMPVITWRLLENELDPELFYNLQQLALKYGYSIDD